MTTTKRTFTKKMNKAGQSALLANELYTKAGKPRKQKRILPDNYEEKGLTLQEKETTLGKTVIPVWEKGAIMPKETEVDLSQVIMKLEQAFSMGSSVLRACAYAGITKSTYYRWINQFPLLKDRFEELQENPILLAEARVMQGISESYSNAMDYLERKAPNEYGKVQKNMNVNLSKEEKVVIMTYPENDIEFVDKLIAEEEKKKNESV